MIIIDEAAHIDPALFYKTILPILQMKNTCLLALSSPEGTDNYYSKLINLMDETTVPPTPFFNTVDCFMICEACRKLEDRLEQIKCNHVKQTAHWLSKRKGDRMQALYKSDPATYQREMQGLITDDYVPCFNKEHIERLFTSPPWTVNVAPEYVFVAVDPNGGGPSQMAIASGYWDKGNFVVSFIFIFIFIGYMVGPIMYSWRAALQKFVTM